MQKNDHDQFDDEPSRQLAEAVVAALDAAMPQPSARLRAALEEKFALTEDPKMAEAKKPFPNQPAQRNDSWWSAIVVALCLLVGLGGLVWYLNRNRISEIALQSTSPAESGDRSAPNDEDYAVEPDMYTSTDAAALEDRFGELQSRSPSSTTEGTSVTIDGREYTFQGKAPANRSGAGDYGPAIAPPRATPPMPDIAPPSVPASASPGDPATRIGMANVGRAPPQQFRTEASPGYLSAQNKSGSVVNDVRAAEPNIASRPPGSAILWGPRGEGDAPSSEEYARIHENAFLPVTGETAVSTFSIDVDTASYSNVRRYLRSGWLPPPDAVRIEELVNYFSYDYPQPKGDTPFSVNMELAGCPWNDKHQLLRVALKGREIETEQRPAANLVFLLDVSGSMQNADKLPLLKEAMKLLVGELRDDDRVAIVTYAGSAGLALDSTPGSDPIKIRDAIDVLRAGGSTNGSAGIQQAYQKAIENYIDGGVNRVILATDGDLNVGITRNDELVALIKDKAASGVFLSVLGFGTGNLQDAKLEGIADNGNGVYAYIDSLKEAQKVLVQQCSGSLVTIAKDVKIQIEFNPAEVASYRLLGYENRILATKDFDDDKKDAGEIGAGHTVTALYELVPPGADEAIAGGEAQPQPLKYQQTTPIEKPAEAPQRPEPALTEAAKSGELLTLSLRYKQPEASESTKLEFSLPAKAASFNRASPDFQFASSVALFGMLLRGSKHSGTGKFATVEEIAGSTVGQDPHGYRQEFVELVRIAEQLSGPRR
jgi:Ca-activated chloride channel family protein